MSDGPNNTALAFYFGYLGVSGSWDSSGKTASISGALAQIVASWENIFVYYNNDGVNGFQWNFDHSDIFDCVTAKQKGYDCVDINGVIDIRKDLVWGGITVTQSACPTTYNNPNCTIYAMTTSDTSNVLTFTLRLASQPVLVNGVRIEPNYGKIDVTINYPWSSKSNITDASNARVGILAYTVGEAATGSATVQNVNGNRAVNYVANDKSAYFSWDSQATITGTASTVYADFKSGAAIAAYNCNNLACGFWTSLFVYGLQIRQASLVFLGGDWKAEMLIFSWSDLNPATVVWDPAIGMVDSSAAFSIAPAAPHIFAFVALVAFISNMF